MSLSSPSYVIYMSFKCHLYVNRMSLVCHSYVLLYYLHATHMYWHVMACHSYYSYIIRILLICTRISFVFHSYVLACYPYVTRMWFYHEPMAATDRIISQPKSIIKHLKWIQVGGKSKLDKLKVATQASRQRKEYCYSWR